MAEFEVAAAETGLLQMVEATTGEGEQADTAQEGQADTAEAQGAGPGTVYPPLRTWTGCSPTRTRT